MVLFYLHLVVSLWQLPPTLLPLRHLMMPPLQLHFSMSEQPAEPVLSLANPSPVGGNVAPCADTSGSQTSVGTPQPVSPFVPTSDDPASSAAEFSPPPVPSRQALVPSLTLGSAASPAAGFPCSFALAVSLDSSSLPPIRQCEPLFPESPDLFSPRSADSEGPLTTPSNFPVSPCFSSGQPFYAWSFFSEEDDPPSFLSVASEQSESLVDQSLVRFFNNHTNNSV